MLFGPTALNVVVKRILRHVESRYGLPSKNKDCAAGLHILPFEMNPIESGLASEAKQGALVRRIVFAFIRECLNMPAELASYDGQ